MMKMNRVMCVLAVLLCLACGYAMAASAAEVKGNAVQGRDDEADPGVGGGGLPEDNLEQGPPKDPAPENGDVKDPQDQPEEDDDEEEDDAGAGDETLNPDQPPNPEGGDAPKPPEEENPDDGNTEEPPASGGKPEQPEDGEDNSQNTTQKPDAPENTEKPSTQEPTSTNAPSN
ncbi:uncharacterized protein TM35_000521270, partial [Trypanosoma theileri]